MAKSNSLEHVLMALKKRSIGGFTSERRRKSRQNEQGAHAEWRTMQSVYWPERIFAQLEYGMKLSQLRGGELDAVLQRAVRVLQRHHEQYGCITKPAVEEAEGILAEITPQARSLRMMFAGHAHIDMNWLWSWQDTVTTTLETFRTVLNLMDEFPRFTFSQSQASCYRIVEEYEPEMLDRIRPRVAEGRWEVTASQWVEGDKNLPNGESLARQILYAKRYLQKLLDLDPDAIKVGFEPDTFGHNGNMPEIFAAGGVPFMYYCRGSYESILHRWRAPSGSTVLCCREPRWYNMDVESTALTMAVEFKAATGSDAALAVYGVGDHGGGPTRADIEAIEDMAGWPCAPTIEFSTYTAFFEAVEAQQLDLPVIDRELNFRYNGCYSSQARMKQANRKSEATLYEAELFRSLAADRKLLAYRPADFEDAWRRMLLSQFHDILPGAGVPETYQFALGDYQNCMARALTQKSQALQALAAQVDTRGVVAEEADSDVGSHSEGGGVGYGTDRHLATPTSRDRGLTRVFNVFNPLAWSRKDPTEIVVWDWRGDIDRLEIRDHLGTVLPHQIVEPFGNFQGHTFVRLIAEISVPALGYTTVAVSQRKGQLADGFRAGVRNVEWDNSSQHYLDTPPSHTMENAHVCARFHPANGALLSLVDKASGQELVAPGDGKEGGRFRLITEDPKGNAWRIHAYTAINPLAQAFHLAGVTGGSDSLRQSISWETTFGASRLKVCVTLDRDARELVYDCTCDWREFGSQEQGIPQLNFMLPLNYAPETFRYDRAFGCVDRTSLPHDVPANSWAMAVAPAGGAHALLAADSHCAFRGDGSTFSMTLIRGSRDPDPCADIGAHHFRFVVAAAAETSVQAGEAVARLLAHPASVVSTGRHEGTLPPQGELLQLEGEGVLLSSVKRAEEGKGSIVRLYEVAGESRTVRVKQPGGMVSAQLLDLVEQPTGTSLAIEEGDTALLTLAPYQTITLRMD